MMKYDTVILGTVIRPGEIITEASVAIKDGVVKAVGQGDRLFDADEVINAKGCYVFPGAIDAHVHSLGEETEGYINSTKAAAAGGITTIVDHPLDLGGCPVGFAGLQKKKDRAEKEAYVDFALLGGVTPDLVDAIEDCLRAGIAGFKMLMHDTAPETMPMMNDGQLLEAFRRIAPTGLFAGVHAENEGIVAENIRKFRSAGKTYPRAHCEVRPEVSETEAVQRACEFAIAARCRLHVFHVSVPRAFTIISRARKEFPGITGETAPHYLVMDESEMDRQGAYAKINPPLRSAEAREGLWECIRRREVAFIASDHAPHSHHGKESPDIFENQSGAPAVETMLPVVFDEGVVKGRIGVMDFVELFTGNPARILGLYPKKGTIAPGSDADIVIFDPKRQWTIQGKDLHYPAGWTPYEGRRIVGRPVLTMVRGKTVYKDGEITGVAGYGSFVPSNARRAGEKA